MKYIGALLIISALVLPIAFLVSPPDKDSSDPLDGRSGMNIRVDELTQCHYLQRNSALIPRMGADGKQLCGKDVPR